MTIRRTTIPRAMKFLGVGPRQIRGIASDGKLDLVGDILEPQGVRLDEYRRNAIVLAQHDANQPIARCAHIGVENNQVVALIEFPPEGTSDKADEYLRLIKAGIVGALSVGFIPHAWSPISGTGLRFTDWTLLELSCVSMPANPSALVTERSLRRSEDEPTIGQCGRPVDSPCGMKDPSECAIHAPDADEDDDGERAARLQRARARQRRLREAVPLTCDAALAHVRTLRERYGIKRVDPRVVTAESQFRMRNW
jgi:HK97 family phage prohead protease